MKYFLSVCVFALSCFVSFAEEPLTADTLRKGGNTASEPLDMPHVVMDFPSAGTEMTSPLPLLSAIPVDTVGLPGLTLDSCLRMAIEANYGVRLARIERDIAANNVTFSPFLPDATLNGRQTQDILRGRNAYRNETAEKKDAYRSNQYSADLTVGWTLFDGLAMFAEYENRKELLREGELNLRSSIESLVADVAEQYYYIVTQQNKYEATKLYLAISALRYAQAKERYELKAISGLELAQAKIDFNADSSQVVQQREVIRNAYIRLFTTMNTELGKRVQLTDSITTLSGLDLGELTDHAMEHNTAILLARSGQVISEQNLRIARAERYPTLDFTTAYKFNRSDNEASPTRFSQTHGINWGFRLSANLFNGFETRRKIRNAEKGIEKSELNTAQVEWEVRSNLAQQYNTYRKNLAMIGFEGESAATALLNLQAAMLMYRVGTISAVEFREIQRSYLEAVDRQLQAQYQAKISEISLRYYAGMLLD